MPVGEDELAEMAAAASKSLFTAMGAGLWTTLRDSVRRMSTRRGRRVTSITEPTRSADRPAAVHQQNTAYDPGRVFASQHGSQHLHIRERQEPK